ncbi:MAG: ComEC family competence protein [Paludibacteraceae bacterium]|nr:ComEC family competence protein [Paludibacteraceae bacterium]
MRRYPMAVLLLPLIVGILWCHFVHSPIDLLQSTEVKYLDSVHIFKVAVRDFPRECKKTWQYEVDILLLQDSATIIRTHERAYLYIHKDSLRQMPEMGDTLWVQTAFRRGQKIGDFDYGLYLRRQGLIGSGYVPSHRWTMAAQGKTDYYNPRYWQYRLRERYRAFGIEEDELATLSALTLGYKEDLDTSLKRSFQRAGAAHILAVSGLHTGIIYSVILLLLNVFGFYPPLYEEKGRRIVNGVVCIILLWGYALLTGMTPSVVRSVVMFSLVEIARMAYRQPVSLNTVMAAAFLILAFRPNDLFSVSFQLSFAAVVAIVLGLEWLPKIHLSQRMRASKWHKPLIYVWEVVVVSLLAQLGTMPLCLYYFGQTSNWFLLTNLVVIPLAWLIVVVAVVLLTIGWIPQVGILIAYVESWLVKGLNGYVTWVEQLPGAVTEIRTSWQMAVLLYVAIATGVLTLKHSRWWLIATGITLADFCYLYTL